MSVSGHVYRAVDSDQPPLVQPASRLRLRRARDVADEKCSRTTIIDHNVK